jgi:hypothetical protein
VLELFFFEYGNHIQAMAVTVLRTLSA